MTQLQQLLKFVYAVLIVIILAAPFVLWAYLNIGVLKRMDENSRSMKILLAEKSAQIEAKGCLEER